MFAFADDTIAAKTAAPIRVLGLRGYTDRFRSVSYAIRTRFANNKIFWAALCESPPEVSCDVTAECFILYSGIGGVGVGLGEPAVLVVSAVALAALAALMVLADITKFASLNGGRRYCFAMMRAAALLGFVAITLFAQEPNKDPDSFDIEPPLLIPNRQAERLSNPH